MPKETVKIVIEGGKATAGPPLGPALGPLGVNVGLVVKTINEKTADFKGMQVPVTVIVDTQTKEFEIKIGTPATSSLIKKELNIETAAHNPSKEVVGNLTIQQVIKIANMKQDNLSGKTIKERVKEIAGTCVSMGVNIEGKSAKEFIHEVNQGKYDNILKE
ncbi:MAG: 50S ribosomal protein L11 [Candidatus Woesearchaeota archaeon]